MGDESIETVEQQLTTAHLQSAPAALRGEVLRGMQRELRASRWDRRFARAAAVLLALGVGMNAAIGLQSGGSGEGRVAQGRRVDARPSFVDTAIVLAEATDAATAQRFARQMAAMAGRKLTDDEAAAIEAAVRRPVPRSTPGSKG